MYINCGGEGWYRGCSMVWYGEGKMRAEAEMRTLEPPPAFFIVQRKCAYLATKPYYVHCTLHYLLFPISIAILLHALSISIGTGICYF